jgi:WD40 repeat protein
VAFSTDRGRVVSGYETVEVWNVVTGESEWDFEGHSGLVTSIAFSSDGGHIVSGSDDKMVR